MKRMAFLGLLLAACGCGKVGDRVQSLVGRDHQSPDAAATAAADGTEEFEGMVDLFGKRVRARRQVRLDGEGNYIKHGKLIAWYENGQKAGEMWYENDKPSGPELSWHENGKKKMLGQSKDGLASGKWIEWYDNGQKHSEGEYLDGERQGAWTFWEPGGQVQEAAEYRLGKKVNLGETDSLSR
jgi:hypothetical protein